MPFQNSTMNERVACSRQSISKNIKNELLFELISVISFPQNFAQCMNYPLKNTSFCGQMKKRCN